MKRNFRITKRQERDRNCPNGEIDFEKRKERKIRRAEDEIEEERI